jgi:hypothetical protein
MLPEPENGHSLFPQHCGVAAIPLSIAINFGLPEWPILARYVATSLAAVPEAPIDEDRQSLFREVEIWCPRQSSHVELPSCNASGCESRSETGFSGPVSLSTDTFHYSGVLGLYIGKDASWQFIP